MVERDGDPGDLALFSEAAASSVVATSPSSAANVQPKPAAKRASQPKRMSRSQKQELQAEGLARVVSSLKIRLNKFR